METTTHLVDPRTGQQRGQIINARESEISQALTTARAAQEAWAALTPKHEYSG